MRYIYIILCFILFSSCHGNSNTARIHGGTLDLRKADLSKTIFKLNGEWRFYWKEMRITGFDKKNEQLVKVPDLWNDIKVNGSKIGSFGYATYQLTVILPKAHPDEFALRLGTFATAAKIFVNGYKVTEEGRISDKQASERPAYRPHLVRISTGGADTLDVRVVVSNFHHRKGGFWDDAEFGESQLMFDHDSYISIFKAFLLGCIFIMALYHLGLFTIRGKDLSPLYFSLFYFVLFARICVTGDMVLPKALDFPWILSVRIEYISFYFAVPLYFMFLRSLFERYYSMLILSISFIFSTVISLITLFTDCTFFSYLMPYFEVYTLFLGIYSVVSLTYAYRKHLTGAGVMIVGFLIFFLCFINDLLNEESIISTGRFLHIGIVVFIFFQAFLLSKRFSKAFKEAERYSTRLNFHNRNLERMVKERTSEIENQKSEILVQSSIIQDALDDIIGKNQEIIAQRDDLKTKSEDITSSLVYAKRIQTAVLPNELDLQAMLSNYFIIYRPKDIVSGDFYWIAQKENKVYIVVADCTGHGVPGAFMSMLGIAFLNEIINKKGIVHSNDLLEELRTQLKKVLGQTGVSDEQKDGMDIGLAILDKQTNILQYSGAYHSLYLFRKNTVEVVLENGEIEESEMILIKGNRQPVGVFPKETPFTKTEIQLFEGDMFYMFTDGYESQFGGDKGEIFKIRRLKELLKNIHHYPLADQKFELEMVFDQWRTSNEQVDDILILGVRIDSPVNTTILGAN